MNYNIGDIVEIIDAINDDVVYYGTVRLIEEDNEIPGLFWLYIRANDEELNVNIDQRIGEYFIIIEDCNSRINKVNM